MVLTTVLLVVSTVALPVETGTDDESIGERGRMRQKNLRCHKSA
jgi:hypothetical protein